MKGVIIDAHIEGKTTYVTKQTKYGTFTCKVTLYPEDEDVKSEVLGYTLAEIKCDIKALKVKAQCFKQRAIGVEHAYNVLMQSGGYCDDNDMLQRQVSIAWKDYYAWRDVYLINKDSYYARAERMLNYRRKIKRSQEQV